MRIRPALVYLAALAAVATACSKSKPSPVTPPQIASLPPAGAKEVRSNLTAFGGAADLKDFLRKAAEQAAKVTAGLPLATASAAAPDLAKAEPSPSAKDGEDSITNNQHAGVDEGGIVKVHGDHLVVLRRGRLFTIKVGGDALRPIATVDAFGPEGTISGTRISERRRVSFAPSRTRS